MEITLWWAICEEGRKRYLWFWIETEKNAYLLNIINIKGRKRVHPSYVWLDRLRFFHIVRVVEINIWDNFRISGELMKGNFVIDQEKLTRMLSPEDKIGEKLKEELRARPRDKR